MSRWLQKHILHGNTLSPAQGLDEEGLQAYSRHLQQEFWRPRVRSAAKAGQDADTNDAQDDADAEVAEAQHGPAPEDAARR